MAGGCAWLLCLARPGAQGWQLAGAPGPCLGDGLLWARSEDPWPSRAQERREPWSSGAAPRQVHTGPRSSPQGGTPGAKRPAPNPGRLMLWVPETALPGSLLTASSARNPESPDSQAASPLGHWTFLGGTAGAGAREEPGGIHVGRTQVAFLVSTSAAEKQGSSRTASPVALHREI